MVLAGVAIYFVVRAVQLETLLATAERADAFWIGAAVALLPINIALESAIWLPVLRLVVPRASWISATRAVIAGYPLGFVTPGRVGEFAGRALALSGEKRTEIGLSVAAARIPELAVLLFSGSLVLGFVIVTGAPTYPGRALLFGIALIGTVSVCSIMLVPRRVAPMAGRLLRMPALTQRMSFLDRINGAIGAQVIGLSALRLFVYCLQFVFLAHAFDATHHATVAFEAVVTTFTAKAVVPPVTFLDLGVREGAAAYFFDRLGIGASVGFDAAFSLFVVNIVVPTIVGLPMVSGYRLPTKVVEKKQHVEAAGSC